MGLIPITIMAKIMVIDPKSEMLTITIPIPPYYQAFFIFLRPRTIFIPPPFTGLKTAAQYQERLLPSFPARMIPFRVTISTTFKKRLTQPISFLVPSLVRAWYMPTKKKLSTITTLLP